RRSARTSGTSRFAARRSRHERLDRLSESGRMELTQLQHFLKVVECGGFTRAAEELVMSQPALSRSVARLEEELGQPLFERKPRSVVLTSAGELLEARARRIMALVEDTKAEITDDGE